MRIQMMLKSLYVEYQLYSLHQEEDHLRPIVNREPYLDELDKMSKY